MVGEARSSETTVGPLDGITVLDASRVLVGPFCTMQLGDLGADVIKVERPEIGDQTRGWQPPAYGDSRESAYYVSVNRNKRSITINLASEAGQAAFKNLASEADVLVENFRVGKMEDWGLGYTDLREVNPDLVYCALSGYGEWGAERDRPAYDIIMQAEGGLMSITGETDGPPIRVGVAIADIGAAMYATQAILAALLDRELGSGHGQKIDVSLFDSQVAWMTYMASYYFATGDPPGRMGSKHPTIAPYQAFKTNDGYVIVAVATEHSWVRFCEAIDRPALSVDDRFRMNADRVENREELDALLDSVFSEFSTEDVISVLTEYDVPASTVNDLATVFEHPQVTARGMRATIDHPTAGQIQVPGSPMHFSVSDTHVDRHPPLLGEHTDEILAEFGYSDAAITRLHDRDVV